MTAEARHKYEFKKQLEELKSKQGQGTELISLYIPHEKRISDVVAYLRDEHGSSANIKSKSTRDNVQSALESIMSRLKYYKQPPENGMAIFCGAISIGGDRTSMEAITIEPPQPITSFSYRCGSNFETDKLDEMLVDRKTFGLIVLDRREATIGTLKGKKVTAMRHLTSTVPGKQRKGGQSSHRFQQLRLIAINDFNTRIGDAASDIFNAIDRNDFQGILIGGPTPTKEEFVKGEYLHHELQPKILGLFDIAYTDESGLGELMDAAEDTLSDLEVVKEKKLMERFMRELVSEGGLAAYGEDSVRNNLKMGSVDVLLLSEDLRRSRITLKCQNCEYTSTTTVKHRAGEKATLDYGKCPKCQSTLNIAEQVDVVDELSITAEQMNTEVEFISTEFEEGEQLYNAFGGIAAILRYKTGV
ncbi:peptide chain release factor subunit 1 [Methanocella paludicola SANAE]|uniref:Peptide chain release factor subunit 1 n=1 Tax=Methanocella paludicola (strain DSM 17711 / JCM 13418 / NBRC 101707 / SANAE) TaxID=304371 RepID=D1Z230_METPS|nr:peptide chain release factor aRF-1 [Methanocella paludicola]BAI62752.1 peptide chain release factor subunit 1 [Methanocella paludicola SANAE]